ncbi:MAG: hypothetical protein ACYS8K_01940 [Planctomycetota bacterium]
MLISWGCSCEESEPPPQEVGAARPAPPEGAEAPAAPARPPEHKVGESVLHAPADYLRITTSAPGRTRQRIDAMTVQHEVRQFKALEDRYPRSLDELVEWRGEALPELPRGHAYTYDPQSGAVKVVPVE